MGHIRKFALSATPPVGRAPARQVLKEHPPLGGRRRDHHQCNAASSLRLKYKRPGTLRYPGLRVFRCYSCGYVAVSCPGSVVLGCSSMSSYQLDNAENDSAATHPRCVLVVLLMDELIDFMMSVRYGRVASNCDELDCKESLPDCQRSAQ